MLALLAALHAFDMHRHAGRELSDIDVDMHRHAGRELSDIDASCGEFLSYDPNAELTSSAGLYRSCVASYRSHCLNGGSRRRRYYNNELNAFCYLSCDGAPPSPPTAPPPDPAVPPPLPPQPPPPHVTRQCADPVCATPVAGGAKECAPALCAEPA